MNVTPFRKPETYIACPTCGRGEYQVSHLKTGTQTAWYCDQKDCGFRFSLHVLPDMSIELTPSKERNTPCLVTLRSEEPVTIVVEGSSLGSDIEEGQEYFYDESTCPTNYLRQVQQIVDEGGDTDPHGIFKYVKTEPWRNLRD